MPTFGNVTAMANAASIESIANAISANSTLNTVPQKDLGPTSFRCLFHRNDVRLLFLYGVFHLTDGKIAINF